MRVQKNSPHFDFIALFRWARKNKAEDLSNVHRGYQSSPPKFTPERALKEVPAGTLKHAPRSQFQQVTLLAYVPGLRTANFGVYACGFVDVSAEEVVRLHAR